MLEFDRDFIAAADGSAANDGNANAPTSSTNGVPNRRIVAHAVIADVSDVKAEPL